MSHRYFTFSVALSPKRLPLRGRTETAKVSCCITGLGRILCLLHTRPRWALITPHFWSLILFTRKKMCCGSSKTLNVLGSHEKGAIVPGSDHRKASVPPSCSVTKRAGSVQTGSLLRRHLPPPRCWVILRATLTSNVLHANWTHMSSFFLHKLFFFKVIISMSRIYSFEKKKKKCVPHQFLPYKAWIWK